MPKCCVPGCKSETSRVRENFQNETVHKFPFPDNPTERNRWLRSIGLKSITKGSLVCQHHFIGTYFVSKEENLSKKGKPLKSPKLKPGQCSVAYKILHYSLKFYAHALAQNCSHKCSHAEI